MKGNLNEYILTAGLLLLFMAIAHGVYGETVVFNDLKFIGFDRALYATIYLPWHQMSFVLLVSAVGLIISSVKKESKSIQWFVLFITIGNVLMFIISIIKSTGNGLFLLAWPQFLFFLILALLIILGLRKSRGNTD